jgi:arabinogalactan oligomer/maltooligosaccharide transport system permease protein
LAGKQKKHGDKSEISLTNALVHGCWRTKITILISGFGNLAYGQIIKGFCFLGYQVLTWFVFVSFGWKYIADLTTLGTQVMRSEIDPVFQIPVNVPGDNSLQILLYSIFAIAVLAFGLIIHITAVKSSYAAQVDVCHGRRPTNIAQDKRDLFDKNMHTTMLLPPAAGVIAFTVLPIIFMVLLAFTNFDRYHQPPGNLFTWVGLENFSNIFDMSGVMGNTFTRILGWTLIWAVFATFLNYIFGMVVALMINKAGIRFKSMWRTCFVIAIAVPAFVTLLFMRQLLGDMGPINTILNSIGLSSVQFLRNPLIARITVIIVNLWIGIPYTMLITSGILMNIPADLYEAARIDGAGPVRQFRSITLPYMLIVTAPYLITQFIGNINNFNAIYFLTAGGPSATDYYNSGKTDLLVTWLYKLTVTHGDFNLASVIGILTFIISAFIALITFNITASSKKEETFR